MATEATSLRPRLVGIGGPAGVGKSEATLILTDLGWKRVPFAGTLKAMLRTLYETCGLDADLIDEKLEGSLKEHPCEYLCGRTPREAMQRLGGEWGRDLISSDLWISIWTRRVGLLMRAGFNVVVDDLRYSNEADSIRTAGGEVFIIHGPQRRSPGAHSSEVIDFDPDEYIENASSLGVFRANIRAAIKP